MRECSKIYRYMKIHSRYIKKNVNQEKQQHANIGDSWFWEPEKFLSSESSKENDGPTAYGLTELNLNATQESENPAGDERRIVEKLKGLSNEKDAEYQQLFDDNACSKDHAKQIEKYSNGKLQKLDHQHIETIQGSILHKNQLTFDLKKLDGYEKIDLEKEKVSDVSELNRLRMELDEINGRLSILNEIKSQYDVNVSTLSTVIAERNELEERVRNIQAVNDELLLEVQVTREAVEKLEILQQNLDEINSEKEQNEAALVALQEGEFILQKEFDQLKADKEKLVTELDSTKLSQVELISSLRDKCIELEIQLDQFKKVHINLQTEHEHCEQRYQDLQAMHAALKNSAVKIESNLVEENMIQQKRVIDLQLALDSRCTKNEVDDETLTLIELRKIMSDTLNYSSLTPDISIKAFLEDFLRSVKETYQHLEEIEMNRDNLMKQFKKVSNEKETIEHEYETLKADLHHYESEVAELMKNNGVLLNELESAKSGKLETISEHNEDNILCLEKQLEDFSEANRKLQEEVKHALRKLEECEREKNELFNNINELENQVGSKSKSVQELMYRIEVCEGEKSNLRLQLDQMRTDDSKLELNKDYEEKIRFQINKIDELNKNIDCLSLEKMSFLKKIEEFEDIESQTNQTMSQQQSDYGILKNKLVKTKVENESLCEEINSLKQTIDNALNDESSLDKLKQKNERLEKENLELTSAIQQKHNENAQYHAQMLQQNQILVKLQQTLAAQNEKYRDCPECTQSNEKLEAFQQENVRLSDHIASLKNQSTFLRNELKLLEEDKIKANEENQVIMLDIKRLQEHLIEKENAHTAEIIELQSNLELTRHEMSAMQEEVRQSKTAFTSASIRANQHTETLQAQYTVLQQQKDDLSAKLSETEDREYKNRAALTNLQCVLEQFQRDKERDIEATTNRVRLELNEEISKRNLLFNEIHNLKLQLEESKAGLLAATRISDQLERSLYTNSILKEELRIAQDKLRKTEERLRDVESNQADRVDKNLLKNLFIGYIVATNNDKLQILKLISSVLDFNKHESNKVGLNKSHSNWLKSIMHSSGAALDESQNGICNKDSVVAAFVEFLEHESQPRNENVMPSALLNISSPTRNEEIKQASVQKSLLPGEVLQFNTSRNSSSILKDILSDT